MNFEKIDMVTKLPNIYAFLETMRNQKELQKYTAVIKIVLNRFQRINSIYNYEFGDEVLYSFASKLQTAIGNQGTIFRMDGTKFAICLYHADKTDVMQIYEQIKTIAHSEIEVNQIPITLTLSGGALLLNGFSGNEQNILSAVTQALMESKNFSHGDLVLFEEQLEKDVRNQMALMNIITQSVYSGCEGFYLHYQPIIRPDTGEIRAAEALLRWHSPIYGSIPPGVFIPWIENNPCFLDLGEWILRQAMTDGKKMLEIDPEFILCVNIAYSQLKRGDFHQTFINLLEECDFPAQHIALELTERCYNADMNFLKKEAQFFKSMGVSLVLDDFGTEYSSLNLLCEVSIDRLKIDMSFIKGIIESEVKQIMVDTVVQCAHRLGILVCIEGVEDEELRQYLKHYNVDRHQGYYYAKPMPIENLLEMMGQNPVFEPLV